MTTQTNIIRTKQDARDYAIMIQQEISNKSLSYSELIEIENKLYSIAKRFNLIKEFKENGLI